MTDRDHHVAEMIARRHGFTDLTDLLTYRYASTRDPDRGDLEAFRSTILGGEWDRPARCLTALTSVIERRESPLLNQTRVSRSSSVPLSDRRS